MKTLLCRPDPSLMGDKFEGRMLIHLLASCFTEDSYLRVQLTSQVSSHSLQEAKYILTSQDFRFLGRQLCSLLLGLGVLRPLPGQDNVFKVVFKIRHHRAGTDNFPNDPMKGTPVTRPVIIELP